MMLGKLIDRRKWASQIPFPTDKILVRNLSVTTNAGLDVWSRQKPQPALICITLYLQNPFQSASDSDVVDNSTVNYGILSKNILARVQQLSEKPISTSQLLLELEAATRSTVTCAVLAASEIDVLYTKASMLGEGIHASILTSYCENQIKCQTHGLHLKNIRIPCIIGINSHERTMKQAVVANLWLDPVVNPKDTLDGYTGLEQIISQTIESSSFETLESLAATLYSKLIGSSVLPKEAPFNVKMRVEKPIAVPFADAPAVEIHRTYVPHEPR